MFRNPLIKRIFASHIRFVGATTGDDRDLAVLVNLYAYSLKPSPTRSLESPRYVGLPESARGAASTHCARPREIPHLSRWRSASSRLLATSTWAPVALSAAIVSY
jgi:hypothetical protein